MVKNLLFFENVNMFTNQTHQSRYTPTKFRSEKTINMASVSSHIDIKNFVSDFWHMCLLFFYKRIKFEKGKKKQKEKKMKCMYNSPIFYFRETEKY